MTRLTRCGWVGLAVLSLVACQGQGAPARPNLSAEVRARIRAVEENILYAKTQLAGAAKATIWDRLAHHHVQAVSIAVISNYQLDWAKAYGWADHEARRAATAETIFEPGSISKSLNALAVLRLAEDRVLDLDRDINQYLKSWKFPYDSLARGKPITLAMILSHTAGLGVRGFWGYLKGDSLPSVIQVLDGIRPANSAPVRSQFEPGVRFQYSGGGTMISQQILTDVTGQGYADLLRERVLAPLGMSSSSYDQPPPEGMVGRLATAYTADGKPLTGKFPVMVEQAAAGLWTTPSDLARFIIDLQLSLRGRSNKVLSTAMARRLVTPPLSGAPGLGVFIVDAKGTKYFEHGAGNNGFSGRYLASLEGGNGVVVLINSDAGYDLVEEVINTVAQVYRWKGFEGEGIPVRPSTPAVQLPDSVLDRFVGSYRDGTRVATIMRKGSQLQYVAEGSPWDIQFVAPTVFVNAESADEKQFVLDGSGHVSGMLRTMNGREVGRATKVPVVQLPESLMTRYAGDYRDANNTPVLVSVKSGNLWLNVDGLERQMFFLSTTECYTTTDYGLLLHFEVAGDGRITGITAKTGSRSMPIKRMGPP